MALSGLEIYKLLPRTNCKKCGYQTCLAFAMQLAKKAVVLDKCPFVKEEARGILEEASMPAMRLVEIGTGEDKVAVGNETVLFRHEEKFYHPTAIGFIIEDDIKEEELDRAIAEINKLDFERVGEELKVNLIALKEKSKNKENFIACLSRIRKQTSKALVLMPASSETLKEVLELCGQARPLVYCQDAANLDSFLALCKEHSVPIAIGGDGPGTFSALTKKAVKQGVADIVLDIAPATTGERLWQLTQLRRLAVKKSERSLGYPAMVVVDGQDDIQSACQASAYIVKYAGIVLLKTRRLEYILPLLTLRQNIFTDPQKPLQVEPKVYTIGSVAEDSPVLITTNFSLTYYTVLGEIESSRTACHLVCVDTEGMSVLTAWAAEKFTPERLTDTLVKFKVKEAVRHNNLIIPGYVSMMSGDLEEKSGWTVIVGPCEASGIPSFLKNLSKQIS